MAEVAADTQEKTDPTRGRVPAHATVPEEIRLQPDETASMGLELLKKGH